MCKDPEVFQLRNECISLQGLKDTDPVIAIPDQLFHHRDQLLLSTRSVRHLVETQGEAAGPPPIARALACTAGCMLSLSRQRPHSVRSHGQSVPREECNPGQNASPLLAPRPVKELAGTGGHRLPAQKVPSPSVPGTWESPGLQASSRPRRRPLT